MARTRRQTAKAQDAKNRHHPQTDHPSIQNRSSVLIDKTENIFRNETISLTAQRTAPRLSLVACCLGFSKEMKKFFNRFVTAPGATTEHPIGHPIASRLTPVTTDRQPPKRDLPHASNGVFQWGRSHRAFSRSIGALSTRAIIIRAGPLSTPLGSAASVLLRCEPARRPNIRTRSRAARQTFDFDFDLDFDFLWSRDLGSQSRGHTSASLLLPIRSMLLSGLAHELPDALWGVVAGTARRVADLQSELADVHTR